MKAKKALCIIIPILALILELLPFGAVLNFGNPVVGDAIKYTRVFYSFFSLIPFGYANFGPFITAIITCTLIPLSVLAAILNKRALTKTALALSVLGIFTSLLPLILFGKSYLTPIGAMITTLFTIELILWNKINE